MLRHAGAIAAAILAAVGLAGCSSASETADASGPAVAGGAHAGTARDPSSSHARPGSSTGPGSSDREGADPEAAEAPTSAVGEILFYEQSPLPIRLGQGLTATKDARGNFSAATLFPSTCVIGEVSSTLDSMKELGLSGLGMTVVSSLGLAPDGASIGLTSAPFAPGDRWLIARTAPEPPAWTDPGILWPWLPLEQIALFQKAVASSSTRRSGVAEVRVEHNAFLLRTLERAATQGDDCGTHFVRGVTPMRFLSYAFRIDFANETDVSTFQKRFGSVNTLLSAKPELTQFLVAVLAQISVHVLVPTGLANLVKAKVAGDSCDAAHLEACRTLNQHLSEVLQAIPSIPGEDVALDEVMAPSSTWGIYEVGLAGNEIVL